MIDDGIFTTKQIHTIVSYLGIFLILIGLAGSYNYIVDKDMNVKQMQGSVQTSLELRAALIPNLVATIVGSGKFESNTLVDVISERKLSQHIQSNIETAQSAGDLQSQESSLAGVIGRLMLVYEQYPILKTTDQYKQMMDQLASTENDVRVSRNNYNAAVRDYQQTVKSFPLNLIAGILGYNLDRYQMFTVTDHNQNVVMVNF